MRDLLCSRLQTVCRENPDNFIVDPIVHLKAADSDVVRDFAVDGNDPVGFKGVAVVESLNGQFGGRVVCD